MLIDPDNFDNEVLTSNDNVLIDFFAAWCGPCRQMTSIINDIAKIHKVCKIDIEDYRELAARYKIKSVPTFIIFKNGNEQNRIIGATSKKKLLKLLEN